MLPRICPLPQTAPLGGSTLDTGEPNHQDEPVLHNIFITEDWNRTIKNPYRLATSFNPNCLHNLSNLLMKKLLLREVNTLKAKNGTQQGKNETTIQFEYRLEYSRPQTLGGTQR